MKQLKCVSRMPSCIPEMNAKSKQSKQVTIQSTDQARVGVGGDGATGGEGAEGESIQAETRCVGTYTNPYPRRIDRQATGGKRKDIRQYGRVHAPVMLWRSAHVTSHSIRRFSSRG